MEYVAIYAAFGILTVCFAISQAEHKITKYDFWPLVCTLVGWPIFWFVYVMYNRNNGKR